MAVLRYRSIIIPVWRKGVTQGQVTLSAVVDDRSSAITGAVLEATEGTEGTVTIQTLDHVFNVVLPGTAYSETKNIPRGAGIEWGTITLTEGEYTGPLKDGKPLALSVAWVNPDGVMNTEERAVREASR